MARMQSKLFMLVLLSISLAVGCAHQRAAKYANSNQTCENGACAIPPSPRDLSRSISTSQGRAWDALDNDHTMNSPTDSAAGSRYRQQESMSGSAYSAPGGSGSRSAPASMPSGGGGSGSR